jgi:hypothetical protein
MIISQMITSSLFHQNTYGTMTFSLTFADKNSTHNSHMMIDDASTNKLLDIPHQICPLQVRSGYHVVLMPHP